MKTARRKTATHIAMLAGVSLITLNTGATAVLASKLSANGPQLAPTSMPTGVTNNAVTGKTYYTDDKAEADAARKAGYHVITSSAQTTQTTRSPSVTADQLPVNATGVREVGRKTVQDPDKLFTDVAWDDIPADAKDVKQTGEKTISDPNEKFMDGVTAADLVALREQGAVNIAELPDKTITIQDPNKIVDTGIPAAELEQAKADGVINITQIPDAFRPVLDADGQPKKVLFNQVPAGHQPTATDEKQTVVDGNGPEQFIANTPANLQKLQDQGAVEIKVVAGETHDYTTTDPSKVPTDAQDVQESSVTGTATQKANIPANATDIKTLFVKDINGSNLVLKDSSRGVDVAAMTYTDSKGNVYDLFESEDGKSELSNLQDSVNNGTGTLNTYHQFVGGNRVNVGILSWATQQFKFSEMKTADENISTAALAAFAKDGVLIYQTAIANYPVAGLSNSVKTMYMTLTPTGAYDDGNTVYTWNKFYYDKDNTIYYGVKEYQYKQIEYAWSVTDEQLSYRMPVTHEETLYTYGEPLYAYELPMSHEEPLYSYELPASHQEKMYQYYLAQSHEEKLYQYDLVEQIEKLHYQWSEPLVVLKPQEDEPDIATVAGTTPAVMSALDYPITGGSDLVADELATNAAPKTTNQRLPQTGVAATDRIAIVIGGLLLAIIGVVFTKKYWKKTN